MFRINWDVISSHFEHSLLLQLNDKLSAWTSPSWMGPIVAESLSLGSIAPEIEILDVHEPSPPPPLPSEQSKDKEKESQQSSSVPASSSSSSSIDNSSHPPHRLAGSIPSTPRPHDPYLPPPSGLRSRFPHQNPPPLTTPRTSYSVPSTPLPPRTPMSLSDPAAFIPLASLSSRVLKRHLTHLQGALPSGGRAGVELQYLSLLLEEARLQQQEQQQYGRLPVSASMPHFPQSLSGPSSFSAPSIPDSLSDTGSFHVPNGNTHSRAGSISSKNNASNELIDDLSCTVRVRIRYRGDASVQLRGELVVNAPIPRFMVLPIVLHIEELDFDGVLNITFMDNTLTVFFEDDSLPSSPSSFSLMPSSASSSSLSSLSGSVPSTPSTKPYPLSALRASASSGSLSSLSAPAAQQQQQQQQQQPPKVVPGIGPIKSLRMRTDVGNSNVSVLKDAKRVEEFFLDLLRQTMTSQVVQPNRLTFENILPPQPPQSQGSHSQQQSRYHSSASSVVSPDF